MSVAVGDGTEVCETGVGYPVSKVVVQAGRVVCGLDDDLVDEEEEGEGEREGDTDMPEVVVGGMLVVCVSM